MMICIEDAQRIILKHTAVLPVENVPLLQLTGRIMAEDVYAPWDIPVSDNSAMDGYAFSSHSAVCGHWLVAGFVPAGGELTTPVAPGEAVRIMTGAPIPPGCDTVMPVEDVELTSNGIRTVADVKTGAHIRKRGEDVQAGTLVITAGSVIRPQEIGLLVSMGRTGVPSYRKVRVAILATGDELLEAGSTPTSGRTINSNSYSLAAQVLEAGGEPVLIGIAADTAEATREKILEGLNADILITTGGVSVGDRDFVKESIQELGGKLLFWKVNMKPGKPVAFARLYDKCVFALPGNPVAAMVAFEMFVRPAMLRMMGHTHIFRPVVRAVLTEQVQNRNERPHLIRVRVSLEHGIYRATPNDSQSSANLSSLTGGNGLMRLEPNTSFAARSAADVTVMDRSFEMGVLSELRNNSHLLPHQNTP